MNNTFPSSSPITSTEPILESIAGKNPEISPEISPETKYQNNPETSHETNPETNPETSHETNPVTSNETYPETNPGTSQETTPEISTPHDCFKIFFCNYIYFQPNDKIYIYAIY